MDKRKRQSVVPPHEPKTGIATGNAFKCFAVGPVQTARNNGATFNTPAALNGKREAAPLRAALPEV